MSLALLLSNTTFYQWALLDPDSFKQMIVQIYIWMEVLHYF